MFQDVSLRGVLNRHLQHATPYEPWMIIAVADDNTCLARLTPKQSCRSILQLQTRSNLHDCVVGEIFRDEFPGLAFAEGMIPW
jgi:hypothetical protein